MTDLSRVTFRETQAEDAPALRKLYTAAFGGEDESRLVEELIAADAVRLSLAAMLDDALIAHVLFSPVVVEREGKGLQDGVVGLGPIAVHPDHQRQGVGYELLRGALSQLTNEEVQAVMVLGNPAYFPRLGFKQASLFGLKWEHACPPADFMGLELRRDSLAGPLGVVRYRPEFSTP